MILEEFSKVNRQRSESPDGFNHKLGDWSLSDWFTATVGELGEAANVAKKLNRVRDGIGGNRETEPELRAKLASELADTFIYLDLLAQAAGIDLAAAVVRTFNAKSEQIGSSIRFGAIGEHVREGPARNAIPPGILVHDYYPITDEQRHTLLPGDRVAVRADSGVRLSFVVSEAPRQLYGTGTWVIGLEGVAGGYLLERVTHKRKL